MLHPVPNPLNNIVSNRETTRNDPHNAQVVTSKKFKKVLTRFGIWPGGGEGHFSPLSVIAHGGCLHAGRGFGAFGRSPEVIPRRTGKLPVLERIEGGELIRQHNQPEQELKARLRYFVSQSALRQKRSRPTAQQFRQM
jgi:hypothetical protein